MRRWRIGSPRLRELHPHASSERLIALRHRGDRGPARGYSNVSIAGGRAYTLGFDEKKKQDSLFCIDVATGRELWREQWPAIVIANFHGGGTLTTPSIDGDVVYVSTREGRCFAFGT